MKPIAELPLPVPGETDEDWCRRAFEGEEFPCRRCKTTVIYWPGVCDACDADLRAESDKSRAPATTDDKLRRSGMPEKMISWRWTGCTVPDGSRLSDIRGWDGTPTFLVLYGPTGTGKTGAAACLARDWVINGGSLMWRFAPDWLDSLRSLEREGDPYVSVREAQSFHGLLVLDEIITKRITDYGLDRLFQVIEGRDSRLLPTVVTTNTPPLSRRGEPSIKDLEPRIGSRLGGGQVLQWFGSDRRLK